MLGLVPGTVDNNVVDGMTRIEQCATGEVQEILFSNGPVLRDCGDGVEILARTRERGQVVAARHGATFAFSYHDYDHTHPEFLDFCLSRWAV